MTKPCILAIAMMAVWAALNPADGAITLPTDGTWTSFDWFEAPYVLNDFTDPISFAGQLVQIGPNLDFLFGPFTYSSSSPLLLDVIDVFENGDRFSIFLDGNSLLGQTTAPDNDGVSVGNDIDAALADDRWSRGTFPLPTGTHQIFIKTTEVPFSPPAVPQPLKGGRVGCERVRDRPYRNPQPSSTGLS